MSPSNSSTPNSTCSTPARGRKLDKQINGIVARGHTQFGAKSTFNDYKRIYEEYCEFSTAVYGNLKMDTDRVYKYLFFTAYRDKRDNPKKRKLAMEQAGSEHAETIIPGKRRKFCMTEYQQVMDEVSRVNLDEEEVPSGDRLQTLDKHYSAMMEYAPDSLKPLLRDHGNIKKLRGYVTKRKKTADSLSYKEKVNPQLEKYEYPEYYPRAERYFWDKHQSHMSLHDICSSMRNRYTFLTTMQTVTRHESCVKCKLSNFQFITCTMRGEIDPYPILVRNINVGKTVQADSASREVIQAKSIRHKDVNLCEQGGLGMYLFCRFQVTDEEFDLCENEDWFSVKTLVVTGHKVRAKKFDELRKIGISPSSFGTEMNKCFTFLGVAFSHILHFGRAAMPVVLEFAGVIAAYIKELGNWDMGVFERHYSSKMAWPALRAAAGFQQEVGYYYVPRAHVPVPQDLKDLVYPNITRARRKFEQLPAEKQVELKTARAFLKTMDHLAAVFVQDSCVMLMSDRQSHSIFHHPFFHSNLFTSFQESFSRQYQFLCRPENDPSFDKTKQAVPIIGHHLHGIHSGQAAQTRILNALAEDMHGIKVTFQQFHAIQSDLLTRSQHFDYVMDAAVEAHANSPHRVCRVPVDLPTVTPKANIRHLGNGAANEMATHEEQATTGADVKTYPAVPDGYSTLEEMYDDWHGCPGSQFASDGGIKAFCDNREYRKTIPQNVKKFLQRLSFINRYVAWKMEMNGITREDAFGIIHDAFKGIKKRLLLSLACTSLSGRHLGGMAKYNCIVQYILFLKADKNAPLAHLSTGLDSAVNPCEEGAAMVYCV